MLSFYYPMGSSRGQAEQHIPRGRRKDLALAIRHWAAAPRYLFDTGRIRYVHIASSITFLLPSTKFQQDASRFTPNDMNFTFSADDSRPLTVGLQAIQATNTFQGVMSLLPGTEILSLIDSTVP